MVLVAMHHAAEQGWGIVAAVQDASGLQRAAVRMDDVVPVVSEFALDKAFTAASMRRSTVAFGARMDSIPTLRTGLSTRSRLPPWGGGMPLLIDGDCLGGIGVSGARDEDDIACALRGLEAAGFAPPDGPDATG